MFDKNKTLVIGCDHGGYERKGYVVNKLRENGYTVKDMGTHSEESVDYPDFIHPVASGIQSGEYERGIIICGSGNGAQMTANKYSNVRAALCWKKELAELARLHNNANILSIPGRFVSDEEAWEMVDVFIKTCFEGGRHQKRVEKISQILK